jgi:hypothetical protein
VDPTLTRADRLVGQVLGQIGELPNVYSELEINFFLLRRLLGVRSKEGEKGSKVRRRGGAGGAGGAAAGGAAWVHCLGALGQWTGAPACALAGAPPHL